MIKRCNWCGNDPLYVAYHDDEWGVECRDSRALFELLMLESFQAGLSWITILRKRENFRRVFAGFDPDVLAQWGEPEILAALADAGIVRHRGKIEATIRGARAWLKIEAEGGFVDFIWQAVDGNVRDNRPSVLGDIPAKTPEAELLAKRLKAAGFGFCGPTITYAFMQAAGLVNDHMQDCFRRSPA